MDSVSATLSIFGEEKENESADALAERVSIRSFLTESIDSGVFAPECDAWLSGFTPNFSRELGHRGWIGMTWPKQYGGRETSQLTRMAVIEELLAFGAPVAAHWFSDRQIGPSLLRNGTSEQKQFFLPRMASGELYFCVGMSEPDAGSDLSSVRSSASRGLEGWLLNGSKVWTSHAQYSHFMLALVRTGGNDRRPADSLSQFLIDMESPGISVKPIRMVGGREDFCEVFFDQVFVPDSRVLGRVDHGWQQVTTELGFERSGPERFLSTFPLFSQCESPPNGIPTCFLGEYGELIARLIVLRSMSAKVNRHLSDDEAPGIAAAIVKVLGTQFENDSIDTMRSWFDAGPLANRTRFNEIIDQAQSHLPGFTLRGGTTEIMYNLIARVLGLS